MNGALNALDTVIAVIVGISCLIGLWRGFVREVLSVVVWVVALVLASIYASHLAPVFETLIGNATARYALAFFLLCLGTLLLGGMINHFVVRLVKLAGLSLTDRLLGAAFGVARGVIVVTLAVFLLSNAYSQQPWWQQSRLVPHLMELAEWSRLFIDDVTAEPDAPANTNQTDDGVN